MSARARRLIVLGVTLLVSPIAALLVASVMTPLPTELREGAVRGGSLRVADREGHVLREVRGDDGRLARWVGLEACGKRVLDALVAVEDQRFASHAGVDGIAVARALWTDAFAFRAVSGASTLTMQLARALRPHSRTLGGKFLEMALALRIERSLTKEQIAEQYLNRVSFGANLRGIGSASQAYFDKAPSALSTAEAATLVGLLRGPSYYELSRHADRAVARRNHVLDRMLETGAIPRDVFERSRAEALVLQRRAPAFGAPHFVRALTSGALAAEQPGLSGVLAGQIVDVQTTLDPQLQMSAEAAAARVPADLLSRHVTAGAAVAVDNETGSILAYVGAPDFFDVANGGQNDGVRALRQPGSTLKPFLYSLAMETLGWTGATVLPDIELHVRMAGAADFVPRDYDEHTRGPVRLREALGNSLNIPAVWTAEQVTPAAFLNRLRALGFGALHESAAYYGPGLALGDGEVSLLDLVRAYAILARGGTVLPLRFVSSVRDADGRTTELGAADAERLLPEEVCSQITDILRDHGARRSSFGEHTLLDFDFDVAAKTGTSKGYRDNWVVGYTHEVTVGVWVGNFDGSPMNGTSGMTGAGPLFHAVMEAAMRGRSAEPLVDTSPTRSLKRVEVCALSGEAPGAECPHRVMEWMPPATAETLPTCQFHERVRVDRRNGLLAGPDCASSDVVDVPIEHFPPEYAAWAKAAGRVSLPVGSSPNCPVRTPESTVQGGLQIANIQDGARFALDPDRPAGIQRLEVRVMAPESVSAVRLRVDGQPIGSQGSPFAFSWPLEEGEHVLVAEADGASSSPPLRVHVRGFDPP
jgi:penicillin-binding protein 1C